MARSFNGSSEYLSGTTPITSDTLTISSWFNSDNASATQATVSIGDTEVDVANDSFILVAESIGDELISARVNNEASGGGGNATTTNLFSVDTWSHACGVYQKGTNNLIAYLDASGVGSGQDTFSNTPAGVDTIAIGAHVDKDVAWHFSGSIAEVAVWNTNLTLLEVHSLAHGFSPLLIRPSALVFYAPLIRDEDVDYISGTSLSATGSPGITAHPRVFRPAPSSFTGF